VREQWDAEMADRIEALHGDESFLEPGWFAALDDDGPLVVPFN